MAIEFVFSLERTAQAAGVLFRAENITRMNYMRLLKLLYIADRESIRRSGRPITGDTFVAMQRGPLPSRTYDLIMDKDVMAPAWQRSFRRVRYDLTMHGEPGVGELSRYEIDLLQEVSQEHVHRDEWDLVAYTHDEFEEFKKHDPGGVPTSNRIPVEDILEAVGRSADAASIARDAEADRAARQLFG